VFWFFDVTGTCRSRVINNRPTERSCPATPLLRPHNTVINDRPNDVKALSGDIHRLYAPAVELRDEVISEAAMLPGPGTSPGSYALITEVLAAR
jgi:hypothetical protein